MRRIPGAIVLALLAVTVAVLGLTACGTGHRSATSTQSTNASDAVVGEDEKRDIDHDQDASKPDGDEHPLPFDSDEDGDNPSAKPGHDSDDKAVLAFGHPANKSEQAQIANLTRRYYAIAASVNGPAACALIYSPFREAIPEDYGRSPPGPKYARGTTCPEVLTHIFEHFHKEFARRLPKLKVAAVRVKEREGVAVLSFGGLASRELRFEREGKTWRVLDMIDDELP